MKIVIEGKAHLFGNKIDTDQIYPGKYVELTDKKEIASHCMEGIRSGFINELIGDDIIVAGKNFGCGSSREHAVITIKEAGIKAIVAESFARIFFRNAINLGLPVITCKNILGKLKEGDDLQINLAAGKIYNKKTKEYYIGEGFPQHIMTILKHGGIKNYFIKGK